MRLTAAHTKNAHGEPIVPVYQMSGVRFERHKDDCAIVLPAPPEGKSYVCTCGPGEAFEPDIYETCSYCGSIDPTTLLALLKKPGVQYSGADWKGYPHKFYLNVPCDPYRKCVGRDKDGNQYEMATMRHHKFYYEHFKDGTDAELAEFRDLGGRLLGVKVARNEQGQLLYAAVCHNWQTYGTVAQGLDLNQHDLNAMMAKNAPRVPQWFIDKPWPEPVSDGTGNNQLLPGA